MLCLQLGWLTRNMNQRRSDSPHYPKAEVVRPRRAAPVPGVATTPLCWSSIQTGLLRHVIEAEGRLSPRLDHRPGSCPVTRHSPAASVGSMCRFMPPRRLWPS